MKLLRLAPENTKFPFMRFRRVSYPFSALLSIISVVLFLSLGMNFGIDFSGGTLIELRAKNGVADLAKLRSIAEHLKVGDVEVQGFGGPSDVTMRFGLQAGGDAAQQAAVNRMKEAIGDAYEVRRTEVVGPRVSGELVQSGTLGVVVSIVAVLCYLWFRFEWQFAVGAIIATMHDLLLTVGFFALTRLEFNTTSIAAILTIVGYSLNETVVVLDRIREMMRKYRKMPADQLIDVSVNAVLPRTIMTATTVFLALLSLVVFGGEVIRSFSIAMIWGIFVATYSSVFICSPMLIYLGLRGDTVGPAPAATPREKAGIDAGASGTVPWRETQPIDMDYAYCEGLLRRDDRDRWLASLFVPREPRPHIHALYAFSLEAARVGEIVSEPLLGEIRFQWWRDALEGAGEAKANPVAAALLDTIMRFDLPKAALLELISARARGLYGDAMQSVEALESYTKATCANLFRLAALILDGKEAPASLHAALHAGIAYGITGLIRALPWHCARGELFVPAAILQTHGARREDLAVGRATEAILEALADLRAIARAHLDIFYARLSGVPEKCRPAFLPVCLCEPYLRLMEKPGYEPFKTIIELPQWRRQWILWRAARRWG